MVSSWQQGNCNKQHTWLAKALCGVGWAPEKMVVLWGWICGKVIIPWKVLLGLIPVWKEVRTHGARKSGTVIQSEQRLW